MTNVMEHIATLISQLLRRVERLEAVEYPRWIYLTAPLTSTSWDGDARSDESKTKIDLSAVFSAPAGIKAVLVYASINDSDSAATDCYLILSPNDTALQGMVINAEPVNDRAGRMCAVVPCDSGGDIYYQVEASGAATADIYLQIWGYCI